MHPDTSVSGIKLEDERTTVLVLGKHTKLEGDSTHHFYSKNKDQELRLTVYPGAFFSQVSVIGVTYAGKHKLKFRQTTISNFKTEKGIQLGMSKAAVTSKLGECYTYIIRDGRELITYKLDRPEDGKSNLVSRKNMSGYFAKYYFKNNQLVEFEFGFPYT